MLTRHLRASISKTIWFSTPRAVDSTRTLARTTWYAAMSLLLAERDRWNLAKRNRIDLSFSPVMLCSQMGLHFFAETGRRPWHRSTKTSISIFLRGRQHGWSRALQSGNESALIKAPFMATRGLSIL